MNAKGSSDATQNEFQPYLEEYEDVSQLKNMIMGTGKSQSKPSNPLRLHIY